MVILGGGRFLMGEVPLYPLWAYILYLSLPRAFLDSQSVLGQRQDRLGEKDGPASESDDHARIHLGPRVSVSSQHRRLVLACQHGGWSSRLCRGSFRFRVETQKLNGRPHKTINGGSRLAFFVSAWQTSIQSSWFGF